MGYDEDTAPDLASLKLLLIGSIKETGDPWAPFQVVDADGVAVEGVRAYLMDLQAGGRRPSTQRSYSMDLLRWFRFLWTVEVPWQTATRREARDFSRWMQIADKPARPHWRNAAGDAVPSLPSGHGAGPNRVTGKLSAGRKYGAATRAHSESVLRHFYDFHLEVGTGPLVNPFPLARARSGGRVGAHHNPMDSPENHRAGLFRPRAVHRAPRSIPDDRFNELFAGLSCNRDRALVAFWVSTGGAGVGAAGLLPSRRRSRTAADHC